MEHGPSLHCQTQSIQAKFYAAAIVVRYDGCLGHLCVADAQSHADAIQERST